MNLINRLLPIREALAYRHRRREVAGIVRFRFSAGIQQEDVAFTQLMDEAVVVQHLPLHRGDGGESQCVAMPASHFLHRCGHLRFVNAGPHCAVGSQVHLCAQVNALLNQAYFFNIFVVALRNDSFNERYAGA